MANPSDDTDNEAEIDAYHEGFAAFRSGTKLPHPPGLLADAWREGRHAARHASRVQVVMPERPEGYYHTRPDDH